SNNELRTVLHRYNAKRMDFDSKSENERRRQLENDPEVVPVGSRFTEIRNRLRYELVYALDSDGIRIISSQWDRPEPLLGVNLSDREYFKKSIAGYTAHMFAISRVTRTPSFFFSAPIEENGARIGVVAVQQTSDSVGSMLADSRTVSLIVDH